MRSMPGVGTSPPSNQGSHMTPPAMPKPKHEIEAKLLDGLSRADSRQEGMVDEPTSIQTPPRQLISDTDRDGAFKLLLLKHGWAARFLLLPDGRRQILKFLIPGDFVNIRRLTSAPCATPVKTVTECALEEYAGATASRLVQADPSLIRELLEYHLTECCFLESRLADLGRRLAEEKIARLILELHQRLQARGLANGEEFYFPLTQEHLADALGMTPVHVGRTIRALRDKGILEFRRSMLHIANNPRLTAMAGL